MVKRVEIFGLETIPVVKPGDDLGALIVRAAEEEGVGINDGDIIIVAQKVVSKAEGRIVDLNKVKPSKKALKISEVTGHDPRFVEVVLRETKKLLKVAYGRLIVMTKHGFVCANAGVDRSNVAGRDDVVTLLPEDGDVSAEAIRGRIEELTGKRVAVIVSDTHGRPFREGQINVAIGVSGLDPFRDYRGKRDMCGYLLKVKKIAIADELAAAAELVIGQGDEMTPAAIVRGLSFPKSGSARNLVMDEEKWLFK